MALFPKNGIIFLVIQARKSFNNSNDIDHFKLF